LPPDVEEFLVLKKISHVVEGSKNESQSFTPGALFKGRYVV